ncbi:NAD(P)-dependent oxidoreductase [Streptomyces sp. JJ36]|uniref:NAD-dependent epimerase/dehydratase family protein n=1 Tax=Streptomyces sp. JJ36 TaxID=2736645 RepID=UPI001F00EA06|nr:NAD-dependent epimerase/dehydratase family protein [Streptomyces sp. JJ36]MCF6526132.1 NAD-dependent epimerase/dehydratase family protein [Streptomyces sp. JJ36]
MTAPLVVLTGATGFIGSTVLHRLAGTAGRVRLRVLTRRRIALPVPAEQVHADLGDPGSLAGACEGAQVLLHLASYIGADADRCRQVNETGTAHLMREAVRAGVPRVVHLSTTAVYGPGPHRDVEVGDVRPRPASAVSRSRLAAEAHALRAGALVLRAGLVLGPGDRWVVPALAELCARAPGYWNGGRGHGSYIDVADLARLTAAAAVDTDRPVRGVHHAAHPAPVRVRELLDALAAQDVLPRPRDELTRDEAHALLRRNPGRVTERQFGLLTDDHWYRATRLWARCGCAPGPGPLARLPRARTWYRDLLAA